MAITDRERIYESWCMCSAVYFIKNGVPVKHVPGSERTCAMHRRKGEFYSLKEPARDPDGDD